MDMTKLARAQHARELARWFREAMRNDGDGEHVGVMASTAVALEWEAFRLEREGGQRRKSRRPRLIAQAG
ncbi:MAG TPA: hypothetical protein VGF97_06185 [Rhizomicrobium sp.]